ncbi:MAG: YCF48-related protein [Candidatus Sulfotelmatobacter sp.]
MQDVPKIVVMRLQGMEVTDPHPEAELLTAFAEQSLAQSEREFVLGHLARCAECRQILELALPAFESASVNTLSPARLGWLRWPALRWGLATTAVLALVSVGVLQYERREKEEMASSASLNSQIAQQAPSGALEQSEAAPTAVPNQETQKQTQKPASPRRETVARSSSTPAQNDFETARGGSAVKAGTEPATVATARNRAPDQLIQNQSIQNQASAAPYQSYANSDVVKAKAAVPADSTPALAPPNIPLQTAPSLMQRASPRWTINASGGLQRSFDAGKTWEDVNPDAGQASGKLVFRVVAAMGPEVWAGGSGAIVYHSTDSGTRWQQVFPLAAGTNPAGDITDINFSSPQSGKIATSAGEIWTTSDSGQTWRKQ